tara:strand:+ start:2544 stop:2648 length:105 start_codon:yes stop_codon:yes gene_type:complete
VAAAKNTKNAAWKQTEELMNFLICQQQLLPTPEI